MRDNCPANMRAAVLEVETQTRAEHARGRTTTAHASNNRRVIGRTWGQTASGTKRPWRHGGHKEATSSAGERSGAWSAIDRSCIGCCLARFSREGGTKVVAVIGTKISR